VATRFGPLRALLIYHPDAIEEVLVTKSWDFVKSPGVRVLRPAADRLTISGNRHAPLGRRSQVPRD
jgi:hypothetical protein